MHHIPPEPAYFRVRIRRRLSAIGALPVKNAVYALPARDDTREDFEWLAREIGEDGGQASLCEGTFIDGVTDQRLRAAFDEDRNARYAQIMEEADRVRARLAADAASVTESRAVPESRADAIKELAALQRKLEAVKETDFFRAAGRVEADHALSILELELRARTEEEPMQSAKGTIDGTHGRTWVTRRGIRVDRMASAWLIRRFIDPDARFKFVEPSGYRPDAGELRFDMFDGEFTHEGEHCTFETLVERFALGEDGGLVAIAEIVHDLDLKEERYGRAEAPGVATLLSGITISFDEDAERVQRGGELFEHLYAHFRTAGAQKVGDRR